MLSSLPSNPGGTNGLDAVLAEVLRRFGLTPDQPALIYEEAIGVCPRVYKPDCDPQLAVPISKRVSRFVFVQRGDDLPTYRPFSRLAQPLQHTLARCT